MGDKEDIRTHLDIIDFIGKSVVLKPAGRNFKGLCPFHKEKSPSFMVSPERQTFKCFGCGEGGDIFAFYMKQEGVTFPEAVKDLADLAGVTLTSFQPTEEYNLKQQLLEVNHLAAQFYHYLLTKHKLGEKALEYVKSRHVTPSQMKEFQLGYAPHTWNALTDYLIRKKGIKGELVEQTGLAIKGSTGWYDRFRGRIMFPLMDVRGSLVGFSGRILPWTEDDKSGKYINTPETILYHKSHMLFPLYHVKDLVRDQKCVVVVEGEFDVLASLRAHVSNVVAVKGSAFTAEQVKLLQRFCDTIILALDSDNAGIAAAKRAIAVAENAEMNVKIVEVTGGKDPDELASSDPAKWRDLVKEAVNIYDFFLDVSKRQFDPQTLEGKQAITQEMVPLLNRIQNKVIQAYYIKKTAELVDVSAAVIEQEMGRSLRKAQITRPSTEEKAPPPTKQTHSRIQLLEAELLTLIIHYYNEVDPEKLPLENFPALAITKILERLTETKPADIITFASTLPAELQQQFDECFLQEPEKLDGKALQDKYQRLISEVAKLSLRDRLSELRSQLKATSAANEDSLKHQINEVLVQFRRYS